MLTNTGMQQEYCCVLSHIYPASRHRRRVDAGQNRRGTPTVNRDSGVGTNEKTTEQQLHNIPNRRPTKQEIWFKDTPEDGARLAPKHVG